MASSKVSVYKGLWSRLDDALDCTARLTNLYFTASGARDEECASAAEAAVMECSDYLRKNRPFFFSDELYSKCVAINSYAWKEIVAFRHCMKMKIKQEEMVEEKGEIDDYEFYEKIYNYDIARKTAVKASRELNRMNDEVCRYIKNYVDIA
jgi:hypothetical protein